MTFYVTLTRKLNETTALIGWAKFSGGPGFAYDSPSIAGQRILTRLTPAEGSQVEVNHLYESFRFEAIECDSGYSSSQLPTKKIFLEHVIKFHTNIKIVRQTGTGKTLYKGVCIKPLMKLHAENEILNLQEVYDHLPDHFSKIKTANSVECNVKTECSSNGHNIIKYVKFHKDGTWELSIGGKDVALDRVYVGNKYSLESLKAVCNIVEKLDICFGTEFKKTIIITRFHTVEVMKKTDGEGVKCIRSLNCNRVLCFNIRESSCCRTCQRMALRKKLDSNKENAPPKGEKRSEINDKGAITVNDVKSLIPDANYEMIELLIEQARNIKRDPKGRRWSKKFISICLQLYTKSPHAYELLMKSKILIFPSPSLLILYKNRLKQDIGFHEEIFEWMATEAKRRNLTNWSGGLIFDEMSIQEDLQITKTGDAVELTGFTNLGEDADMYHTMRKGKKSKILGTHVLQMLFLGITGFRFPFAHFVTDSIQAQELYFLFWQAVDELTMHGFDVLYTCMDGAQANRSFMKLNLGDKLTTFTTISPCNMFNMILLMDVKHVLKKIRNNVLKSGISDKCTRLLKLPSEFTVQWLMFVDSYKWDCENCLQLHRKLTREHIYPDQQLKMRNYLAEDVLDNEMLNLMHQYKNHLGDKGEVLSGVIEFLENTSVIVRIFKDMRPIRCAEDERLIELEKVNQWFNDWEDSTPKKDKRHSLMSQQCHEDIHSCLVGFVQLCRRFFADKNNAGVYITPGLINSDAIENNFNQQRSTYNGANTNPNVVQYKNNMNSILLGQNTISRKSNAGLSQALACNSSGCQTLPGPLRKRKLVQHQGKFSKIKVIRL